MPEPLSRPTRIVVVGWGPVAARFVEGVAPAVRSGHLDVTVVGAEPEHAYNRVLVAEVAVGRASLDALGVVDATALVDAGVTLRREATVTRIDRERQRVELDSGEPIRYDRLVLATGARAAVPTLDGLQATRRDRLALPLSGHRLDEGRHPLPEGVVALRDLRDADRVLARVRARQRIVVLGAGVLGMEFALAAKEAGASIVAVHHGDSPMARNLDTGAGRTLSLAAEAAGVAMAAHARAEGVLLTTDGDGAPRFQALLLADGGQIDGDLLLLSCGVAARDELASGAGLATGRGVLVDEDLRSWTDPDVFAIGDCAHVAAPTTELPVAGGPTGLIGPGWRQADWLAAQLVAEVHGGPRAAPLARDDRPRVVMLKSEGVDVVAGGDVSPDPWGARPAPRRSPARVHSGTCDAAAADDPLPLEVTIWTDSARGAYLKMVTRGGVLEAFASVGMPRAGAELTLLFERRGELPADRSALLRLDAPDAGSAPTSDPMAPEATVCWCNGVSVGAIVDAAETGARTVEAIGACTRAGTGCGTCKGRIAEILARTPIAQ